MTYFDTVADVNLEAIDSKEKPIDPTQLPVSIASLALLCTGVAGWAAGDDIARGVGFFLFALIGFGSGWLPILGGSRLTALAFGAPIGLAFCVLVGFAMVETRTWELGIAVFAMSIAVATFVHVRVVVQHLRARSPNSLPDQTEAEIDSLRMESDLVREMLGATDTEAHLAENSKKRRAAFVVGLSVAGLCACLVSSAAIGNFDPSGPAALFGAISPAWYAGLVLLITAVILGLRGQQNDAAIPIVALQLALTLSISLAYSEPHSSWAAKHVGITEYIIAHGSVNPHIDIYQAFPGLFAGVAWLCHSVGVADPMVVARWWPPVIDLATLLVFQRLAQHALNDTRRSWMAAAIFLLGNTIGQDYFSPQAMAYLLAITIFAIVYRGRGEARGMERCDWAIIVGISVVVAVSHELTPYIVTGVGVALALLGMVRSRLVPVIVVLPALGWAILNRSTIGRYVSVKQIGSVTTNILPKGLANQTLHKSELIHLNAAAIAGDILIIGMMALIVLVHRRTKKHFAFALCALSGLGLFLANSYGNEGAFRVSLFALPWLAILCADWRATATPMWSKVPLVTLPILLGLFLFANIGIDYIRVVRPGDVQAIRYFEANAPAGSVLYVLGYNFAPIKASGRYYLMTYHYYSYIESPGNSGTNYDPRMSFNYFMRVRIPLDKALKDRKIFVLSAQEPAAAMLEVNLATTAEYNELTTEFARSSHWQLADRTSTASLFELKSLVAPVGRPVIHGRAISGHVLTASNGVWASVNPVVYSYQWDRCNPSGTACSKIPGAIASDYTVRPADIGRTLAIAVTARDSYGSSASAAAKVTPEISGLR